MRVQAIHNQSKAASSEYSAVIVTFDLTTWICICIHTHATNFAWGLHATSSILREPCSACCPLLPTNPSHNELRDWTTRNIRGPDSQRRILPSTRSPSPSLPSASTSSCYPCMHVYLASGHPADRSTCATPPHWGSTSLYLAKCGAYGVGRDVGTGKLPLLRGGGIAMRDYSVVADHVIRWTE